MGRERGRGGKRERDRESRREKKEEEKRKKERKRKREKGRERKKKKIRQIHYTFCPDVLTSYAVDIQSRSNRGKNGATSDVRISGLQPENFRSIHGGWPGFSLGQTHLGYSMLNSLSPVLKPEQL